MAQSGERIDAAWERRRRGAQREQNSFKSLIYAAKA